MNVWSHISNFSWRNRNFDIKLFIEYISMWHYIKLTVECSTGPRGALSSLAEGKQCDCNCTELTRKWRLTYHCSTTKVFLGKPSCTLCCTSRRRSTNTSFSVQTGRPLLPHRLIPFHVAQCYNTQGKTNCIVHNFQCFVVYTFRFFSLSVLLHLFLFGEVMVCSWIREKPWQISCYFLTHNSLASSRRLSFCESKVVYRFETSKHATSHAADLET